MHKNSIFYIALIIMSSLFLLSILGLFAYKNYFSTEDLYKAYPGDDIAFISEQGEEILRIPRDKYDALGQFREGRLFAAKINNKDIPEVITLYMLDKKGNVLKQFNNVYNEFYYDESDGSLLPEFYNGYAEILYINEKDIPKINDIERDKLKFKVVYIDKNGNEIKNIPEKIKKMLADDRLTINRFKKEDDLIFKEMPCEYDKSKTCFGYTDKNNNLVIKPVYDYNYLCCGDWYGRNPEFYDGIAAVLTRDENEPKIGNYTILSGGYRFINKKGEYINNESYEYVTPFYGKLAFVETGDKQGFINRQGKWVWSAPKWVNPNLKLWNPEESEDSDEIIEKAKIIEEYENLKFDKNKLYQAYKEADESWEEHQYDKDENGNRMYDGTSSYNLYIRENIEKRDLDYGKIYDTFYNYCLVTNDCNVDVGKCIIDEFEKLK